MPEGNGSFKPHKVKVTQEIPATYIQTPPGYDQYGRVVPGQTFVTPKRKETLTYRYTENSSTGKDVPRGLLEGPAQPPANSSSISKWADDVAAKTKSGSVNSADRHSGYAASSSRSGYGSTYSTSSRNRPQSSKASTVSAAKSRSRDSQSQYSSVAPSRSGSLGGRYNPTVSYNPSVSSLRSGGHSASVSGHSSSAGGYSSHGPGPMDVYHPAGPGPMPAPSSYRAPSSSRYSQSSYGAASSSGRSDSTVRAKRLK